MTAPSEQTTPSARSDDVVAQLLAAMVRILAGRPTKVEAGDLTITAVAVESGLKRHYLTHKHPELKDLFYQLRDQHDNPVKHDAAELKSEVDDLKRRLGDANAQRRKWKQTADTFARAIHVLTLENAQLRQRLDADPVTSRSPSRSHCIGALHAVASADADEAAELAVAPDRSDMSEPAVTLIL